MKNYTDFGWAIFPCVGKIPLTSNGFKSATKNPSEVIELFAKYKNPNTAIATGAISGLLVLDVDIKNGATGEESLAKLEAQYGKIPDTVQAITASGGRHIYFKHPGRHIGNKTGFVHGLDIRCDGGYVIAPPSIVDGKHYSWIVEQSPYDIQLAEAPAWLLKLIETQNHVNMVSSSHKIEKGQRNARLASIAGTLRNKNLSQEAITKALICINIAQCSPPLPQKEVETIAKSISKYENKTSETSETPVTKPTFEEILKHSGIVGERIKAIHRENDLSGIDYTKRYRKAEKSHPRLIMAIVDAGQAIDYEFDRFRNGHPFSVVEKAIQNYANCWHNLGDIA